MTSTAVTIPDIIKFAQELIQKGVYSNQVQIILDIIKNMCASQTEIAQMDDSIKQELGRVKHALGELLNGLENQENIELVIYEKNLQISYTQGNGGRRLYRFVYDGFETEIGIAERRAIIYILQEHPRAMIYQEYGDKGVYPIVARLKEKGFLQIFIEEQGKIRFRKSHERRATLGTLIQENTEETSKKGKAKKGAQALREDTQSSQIVFQIGDENYRIRKTYSADVYEISKNEKASFLSIKIQETVIQYLRDLLAGKYSSLNPHFQRELGKIGLKVVRKDAKLILEIIPDTPFAEL